MLFIWRSSLPYPRDETEERGWYSCWDTRPHKGNLLWLFVQAVLLVLEMSLNSVHFFLNTSVIWCPIANAAGSHREGKYSLRLIEISSSWWGGWNAENGICWWCWTYTRYVILCKLFFFGGCISTREVEYMLCTGTAIHLFQLLIPLIPVCITLLSNLLMVMLLIFQER